MQRILPLHDWKKTRVADTSRSLFGCSLVFWSQLSIFKSNLSLTKFTSLVVCLEQSSSVQLWFTILEKNIKELYTCTFSLLMSSRPRVCTAKEDADVFWRQLQFRTCIEHPQNNRFPNCCSRFVTDPIWLPTEDFDTEDFDAEEIEKNIQAGTIQESNDTRWHHLPPFLGHANEHGCAKCLYCRVYCFFLRCLRYSASTILIEDAWDWLRFQAILDQICSVV